MSSIVNQEMHEEKNIQRHKKSMLAVNFGLAANIFLAIIKTAVGILGSSPALLADGINSTSDVVSYLVVAIFLRFSSKPADREHPFGHSQFEAIASLTVGSFVITTAVGIFWNSVNSIYEQLTGAVVSQGASLIALWVAMLTIALKIGLFIYTNRLSRQLNNTAIMALAYDHRNDIFSASAALIGITLGRMGYSWVDPLAGALVALVILRTGIQILRESASELMDTVPGEELQKQVEESLAGISGIKSVEDINAHRFGPYLMMNLTLAVDGSLTVSEGDRISTLAERKLKSTVDFLQVVHVHYHPEIRERNQL
ncbi:MAG TPA: cation diffusion facilitator family transporter [Anaerolineales bacterium]|nr:cation diffusion facilitator family transporter [Anaerolineales bacterium]